MRYFKSKLKAISREYTRRDRMAIIKAAGLKCPMCDKKEGEIFLFGPTNYLKQQIKFIIKMDIHVIESAPTPARAKEFSKSGDRCRPAVINRRTAETGHSEHLKP